MSSNNTSVIDAQLNYTRYGSILVLQLWGYVKSLTHDVRYTCWGTLPHGWKVITAFKTRLGPDYKVELIIDTHTDLASPYLHSSITNITQPIEVVGTIVTILG